MGSYGLYLVEPTAAELNRITAKAEPPQELRLVERRHVFEAIHFSNDLVFGSDLGGASAVEFALPAGRNKNAMSFETEFTEFPCSFLASATSPFGPAFQPPRAERLMHVDVRLCGLFDRFLCFGNQLRVSVSSSLRSRSGCFGGVGPW